MAGRESRGERRPGQSASSDLRGVRLTHGLALLPLRLFLGITFVYAGLQKLSDPGFFHPGASTYIGTQLKGFATGTPGGFVLRALATPHPTLAGVGVALLEVVVGLLALVGLATRWAAAVGLALNLLLFLTASWRTSPYFLGPDIVFVFAWLPFVFVGSLGQPALEHVVARAAERRTHSRHGRARGDPVSTRRALLGQALAGIGGGALALGALAWSFRGSYTPAAPTLAASPQNARATTSRTTTAKHTSGVPGVPQGVPPELVKGYRM